MSAFNTAMAVVGGLGGIGGLAGVAALVTAVAKRRVVQADAEVTLSTESRQWVEQFQEETKNARAEAREARLEAAAASRAATAAHEKMEEVRRDAEQIGREARWLALELKRLHAAIRDPYVTIDILRSMVGPEGENGTRSHTGGSGGP